MDVEPQQALELAVLTMLQDQLGYTAKNSGRTGFGEPPPTCGPTFLSVWHDGSRTITSKTMLDELHGLSVTVTVRCELSWDRVVKERDKLEKRLNAVIAMLQKDCHDSRVMNAANKLAGLDAFGQAIGFRVPMQCVGLDPVQRKGPDWFAADLAAGGDPPSGLAQTARFKGPQRVRSIPTATANEGG